MINFDLKRMLFTLTPDEHDAETIKSRLYAHPEVKFVSFTGVDMGGHNTDEKDANQSKETFSEWFDLFLKIRNNGEKPKDSFKESICRAINTLFVGETMDDSVDHIDLTLRRNNEQTSNVQLLSGRISIDNITLKCEPYDTVSGQKHYHLMLCFGKMKYRITLPLLNYFVSMQKNGGKMFFMNKR